MNDNMEAKNWKTDKIQVPVHTIEFAPTCLHLIENGSRNDEPSFAIEMRRENVTVIGQFSFATIKDCFNQLGLDLIKLEKPQKG